MFNSQSFCWLCLLVATGCHSIPFDTPQGQEALQNSDETISITRSSGRSTPGTPFTNSAWEFRPTGECRYSNSSKKVASELPPVESESQWQSRTDYERCRDLLWKARFFHMAERNGEIPSGASHTSIEVRCGAMKHRVCFESRKPPKGISSLMTFLDTCAKDSDSKLFGSGTDRMMRSPASPPARHHTHHLVPIS